MANTFLAEIITPEKVLLRALVEEVTLKTEDGEITFLANHADYLAAVDITLAKIKVTNETAVNEWMTAYTTEHGNRAQKSPLVGVDLAELNASDALTVYAAVHGGFVHVTKEGVRIYSPVAELASSLDRDRIEAALNALSTEDKASVELDAGGGIVNPQLASLLATSQTARAILLQESSMSKKRRAEVRLAAINEASGQF